MGPFQFIKRLDNKPILSSDNTLRLEKEKFHFNQFDEARIVSFECAILNRRAARAVNRLRVDRSYYSI